MAQDGWISEQELAEELRIKLNNNVKEAMTLKRGLNKVTTKNITPLDVKIQGRTLVNLLGRDGNCEDVSKWTDWQGTHVLDTTNFKYGSNGFKITVTSGGVSAITSSNFPINIGKCYLALADVKNGNASNIRLYGDGFGTSKTGTIITDGTKFNISYFKLNGSEVTINTIRLQAVVYGANSTYAYVDGVRLYEIDQSIYDKIDVDPEYTGDKLAEKFPYVDSYQTLQNPYVVSYGKNLLPPFSEWKPAGSTLPTLTGAYSAHFPTNTSMDVDINLIAGQTYSASIGSSTLDRGMLLNFYDTNGNTTGSQIWVTSNSGASTGSFTVPIGTVRTNVKIYCISVTGDASNPMLNLGSIALPFEPQDKSYLYLQTMLADNESAEKMDGKCVKTKKVNHPVLDGSLPWAFNSSKTGYKLVQVNPISNGATPYLSTKYDGKILQNGSSWADYSSASDKIIFDTTGNTFNVSISSADSGWGDAYTPTADEIKAYFMGWRMYYYNGSANVIYNGTGTKVWAKLYCGVGTKDTTIEGSPIVGGSGTTTLPTTMNDQGYTPYQLHYQLATPTTEIIPSEGSLMLVEGDNQVELGEGVVVREVVNPVYRTTGENDYVLGDKGLGASGLLKYSPSSFIDFFKNGVKDTQNWIIYTGNNMQGKVKARILAQNFEPSATYTVTYLAQPYQLTASVLDQDSTYYTNDHTVLGKLASEVEDMGTRLSVVENEKANRKQPQSIAPTLLNGWTNVARYVKDEFGWVNVELTALNAGTTAVDTVLFKLPSGYKTKSNQLTFVAYSNLGAGTISVYADGRVAVGTNIGNSWMHASFRFRAEQ